MAKSKITRRITSRRKPTRTESRSQGDTVTPQPEEWTLSS
uniref:Ribosomal protein L29, putative n=1 Tax=Arabidopsis thaliana TaxID=3702 RepID=Q94F13_ARATH|nr:ribosomal protein L29, putative; 3222-3503 [Arabidopsis thaliana]AAO00968.1 ribosomal protein L29, putative [Arabidopsis thaliana]